MTRSRLHRFQVRLLSWFSSSQRDLPWRHTRDPYAIWISEVMLQQTRVAAVIPYYHRFLERFPTLQSLADAPESELLTHWAGLGYYYRARNLQKAAQTICQQNQAFPSEYSAILALPGIGEYTAAAIASISFNLPHAVLDGNVFRVLSRLFNDPTNIAAPSARKHFSALADSLLVKDRPGDFNQAIMELGATICLPKNPQCLLCPVRESCKAHAAGREQTLPVKTVALKLAEEQRIVFWIERDGHLLLWQRSQPERLMPGFWELPEREQCPACVGKIAGSFRHGITVHNYRFTVCIADPPSDIGRCSWIPLAQLDRLPISTIVRKARTLMRRMTHQKGEVFDTLEV